MPAYHCPENLDQALALLSSGSGRILAGGTDSYVLTDARALPFDVIDLLSLPGMTGIVQTPQGLRIAAGTTWAAIADADLPPALSALQEAALQVGGRQIQNAGTIGGNLCNASPAADGVPPLLVVDAQVELASSRGRRILPLDQFLIGPRQTALARDEVMTAVLVPVSGQSGRSRFEKLGARAYLVISIAMVAVRLGVKAGRITEASVAVGSCSAVARRLPGVGLALIGAAATASDAASRISAAMVAQALAPVDDIRGTAAYRAEAAAGLLRRAVAGALS
jgi:CO/xanthine dehydrogenase FAD-binding subunit